MQKKLNKITRRYVLFAFLVVGILSTGSPALSLDAIPVYEVIPIASQLSAQYENVGISSAASVNETDDAVGFAIINNQHRAFVYTDELGVILLPGLPGWTSHQAFDLTDRIGDMLIIVGVAQSSIYAEPQKGVVWEYDTTNGNATATVVEPLPGGVASSLTDINNLGLAIGKSISVGSQAMVYDHFTDPPASWQLDLPGIPNDINDNNTVAGGEWRASLSIAGDGTITAGPAEDLGTPPDSWWSTISALNNHDTAAARVVTSWSDGNGSRLNGAARYDDLDPAGWKLLWASSKYDSANGINDHGDVVGALGVSAAIRSALYIDALNAAYLIEHLVDPSSPYGFINSVADINNAGTIAAGGGAALLVRQGDMQAPTAPGNLTAFPHLPTWQQPWNAITLTWQNNSDFTFDFTIERREQGAGAWSIIRENWSPTSMWDMDVGLGVTYDYRVKARGLAGLSDPSGIATATSPSDPVDNEDPVVTIISPADGQNVSGRVSIRAEATDNIGVTYMDITIYSGYNTRRLCTGSGAVLECSWNTRKLGDGTYTIQASASDDMGNGDYDSIEVTIGGTGSGNQPPTASFTDSCSALSCTFDSSASSDLDGSIVSYSWDFGDGSSSTAANPGHDYATAGSYTVSLTVTDNLGATGYSSRSITVTGDPSPTVVVHVGDIDGAPVPAAKGRWKATVTVLAHDGDHSPASGVTVSGRWSNGARGSGACVTVSHGSCAISTGNLKKNVGSVTFTVNDVSGANTVYNSSGNHDPDGDSDGSAIDVSN